MVGANKQGKVPEELPTYSERLSVSTYKKEQEGGGSKAESVLGLLGFTPARRDLDMTPAERVAMEIMRSKTIPPRTPNSANSTMPASARSRDCARVTVSRSKKRKTLD
jgi:hypothetical protein